MKLKNKNIVITSNEPWGDIWYSKQNWAYELSKKNKVFFVNPSTATNLFAVFGKKIKSYNYNKNLTVIDYESILPFKRFLFVQKLNDLFIGRILRKWLSDHGCRDIVLWMFDPFRFLLPSVLNPVLTIYMRVDRFITPKEKVLIKSIDALVVTARELIDNYVVSNTLLLSHGISNEEFEENTEFNIEYDKGFILYVGNIDHRLDLNLIKLLIESCSNERFVFIGRVVPQPNKLFHELFIDKIHNNLIVHGVEHFKNLKNYINASKACIAPMDISIHGNAIHHHKTLQYLAMGKPILSPSFNDEINKGDEIIKYSSPAEVIRTINDLELTETVEKIEKRICFAKQFTYNKLMEEIEDFLENISTK